MMRRTTALLAAAVTMVWLAAGCADRGAREAGEAGAFAGIEKKHERGPLQVVVRVSPREPTIADTIELALEVTISEDYAVTMPSFGEKLEQFGIRDFRESQPRLVEDGRTRTVRTYQLEPFLSGDYVIPPMTFTFSKKETGTAAAADDAAGATAAGTDADADAGDQHTLETEELKLTVRSLLDEKKEALVIHDIAPPVSLEKPGTAALWRNLGLALAGVAVLAALVVWLVKRRRKRDEAPPPIPAHEWAFRQLEQLVTDDLPRKGELKAFYQRISDILRRYIENRFGLHAPEQTTEEFLEELRGSSKLPPVHRSSLKEFLQHCDLVKFAGHAPGTEEIQRTFDACKHFIIETRSDAATVGQGDGVDAHPAGQAAHT